MEKYLGLQNVIKIKFNDLDLLKKCLIHKSFDNKVNNEKLEFLGDRVLGLILSKKLIDIYPNEKEGIIDKKFANLVNKKICAKIAKEINIKKYMFLGDSFKGLKKKDKKITSDCLEALIGAIFIDKGLTTSEEFILRVWKKHLDQSQVTTVDSKTQLQEYSLKKFKVLPKYVFHKQSGPHHNPNFKVEVHVPNSKSCLATGSSKKNAQQKAAKKLLLDLKM